MTTIRRYLLLPLFAAAFVLAAIAPAQAGYNASAPLAATSFSTLKVAAPTSVSTAGTQCVTTYNWSTGTYTTTLQVKISWPASATATDPHGISGYTVTAYMTNGSKYTVATVGPTTTSLSGGYDAYYATQGIRVSVTTTTSYGWTAESPLSQALTC